MTGTMIIYWVTLRQKLKINTKELIRAISACDLSDVVAVNYQ